MKTTKTILIWSIVIGFLAQGFGQFTKFDPSKAITIYSDDSAIYQNTFEYNEEVIEDVPIRFILIYKESSGGLRISGSGTYVVSQDMQTKTAGFHTEKELFDRVNSGTWFRSERKDVSIEPENIIAIYDLSTAKKIEVTLKEEEKVIQKKVEIQEEKWIDREWVRKQNK